MGNEKTSTPLIFGSCNRLKYVWKINDQQIGALHHQLLSFNELDLKNIQLASKNSEDLLLFENSFVLRFAALRSGKIKISVRVELDGRHLADSVDVSVIDNAYFTHFNADYFKFSKSALKINYHLSFNDFNVEDNLSDIKFNKYCNNNTVQINENGLITIAKLQQYKLKNLNHCSVNLLVTIFINEMNQQQQQNKQANLNDKTIKSNSGDLLLKKQTLLYEIKVKPISYSMLKLSKKKTSLQNTLIRLNKHSLLKNNKLHLNSDGFKMQWHLKHYDDLFDVVSANTRYTMNRIDLNDFSQINSNVFVYDASGNGKTTSSEKEQNDENSDQENLKSISSSSSSSSSSLSLLADSIELSFLIRTLKPGRLVMEISPFAANLFDSKDYLGSTLADLGENDFIRNLDFVKRVDATIGDFICLNERMSIEDDLIMNTNNNRLEITTMTTWSTLNSNVISLVSTENEYNTHDSSVGICISEGQAILKKGSTSKVTHHLK